MTSVTKAGRKNRCAGRSRMPRTVVGVRRLALLAGAVVLVAGCSLDGILKSDQLPPDVTDPAITKTHDGAVAAYHGLLEQFGCAIGCDNGSSGGGVTAIAGLLGDELELGSSTGLSVNERAMLEGVANTEVLRTYSGLQRVRGQASQAIGLLTRYAPEQRALAGHAYVLQGFAEIFLAEFFCSGIPLSTLDFDGDFTLRPGSTTEEVYQHALALLDTAFVLVGDSARFVHLAQMAQARALLGLGRLADAAAVAAAVPDGYGYAVTFLGGPTSTNFARFTPGFGDFWGFSVADRKGKNGVDYRTSGDPRAVSTRTGTSVTTGRGIYHPNKYATDGTSPIVLASAVEARLIEAEAALAQGDASWRATLNALRTNGTFTTQPNANDPAATDTIWNAGSGGTAGLAPLADPGTPSARLDLLFRERAFWLFLTGHRQADLRRLVRRYGRAEFDVYPSGVLPTLDGRSYGSQVTLPIPPEEKVSNPHFSGCISHDA